MIAQTRSREYHLDNIQSLQTRSLALVNPNGGTGALRMSVLNTG